MRVLVFGNPYLEYDSLAVRLSNELQFDHVDFKVCYSPEELLSEEFDYIMDVVEGIDEVKVFDNLKMLNPHRMFSLHDFDVTFFLSLMERLGKIDKVNIIGIPDKYDFQRAKIEVEKILGSKSS